MGEFLSKTVGQLRLHGYPDPKRSTNLSPFARNFAVGPATQTNVAAAGTELPWEFISSGAPAGVNVPITPVSTGILLIEGVIEAKNPTNDPPVPGTIQIVVQVNGTPLPFPLNGINTVPAGAAEAVPFQVQTSALPVGVTAQIQVLLIAGSDNTIVLPAESSSVNIQEVIAATG